MVCPFCGSMTSGTGVCASCGRTLGVPGVGIGALTPPPPQTPTGATVTGLRSPGHAPWVSEGPLALGQAFGSRYRILKLLGAGGMGVVYQAWDQALDLPVALKVIRPEVIADPTAAREVEGRFKRELVLARQVTHRNVVRIHDLGEIDGIKYISMPFIEGKTLASVLAEMGRVPCATALGIIRQIAEGLQAAHEAGVIHRDLKPDNVMIDADGRVVIMDFGISRSAEAGTTLGLTVAGSVIGTVQYMAPEQAMGDAVDERADLYALGLIAYDVLCGCHRLSTATTPVSEMMHRVQHAPPALRTKVPDAPAEIERILARTLEPDPAQRYQKVSEFIADLDAFTQGGARSWVHHVLRIRWAQAGIAAGILILAAVIGILATRWRPAPAPPVAREPVSVLIADFENRAKEPLFEGALEQALAIGIEGASFIGAYPRGDALRSLQQLAPGQRLDLDRARLLARREGINLILAGEIAAAGTGYSMQVRAIDPAPGTELARVEGRARNKEEVLKAIAELASDLRSELGDTTTESARVSEKETFTSSSLEAAKAYSVGQELQWAAKYEESVPYYRKALEADPAFGRAYANWAVSAFYLGKREESDQLYQKAFALIDRMTEREKYRTYGSYYLTVARNYEKAIENYRKLVELYPADRSGHGNLAVAYFHTLNFAKALEEGRKAMRLYPASLKLRNNVALYAMYAGDFASATQAAAEVVKQDAQYYRAYLPMAIAAAMGGDYVAARRAYGRMTEASKQGRSLAFTGLADLAMYEGRFEEAAEILRQGIAYDEEIQNPAGLVAKHGALAETYLALGRASLAIASAQSAAGLGKRDPAALLPAGLVLTRVGREADALAIARQLAVDIHPSGRAYGKVIEGEIALRRGLVPAAADALRSAQKTADLWLTHFGSAVAYAQAGHHAEALAELEACQKRRGEATALFFDDVPSVRYLATLPYWLGRVRQAMGNPAALENYRSYVALRQAAKGDPLVEDARRRLAAVR